VSDVTAPSGLADPGALSDAELDSRLRQLEREEQSVSRRRTTLHTRIDFVRSGGFASTDPELESLATLLETERELSENRLELHAQIDALRAERSLRRL
jgi:predicted  nucleic acid-binding Zn-ribbon protein